MAINRKTQYLYQLREGTWMFQIFIPSYLRHLFSGKTSGVGVQELEI